MSLLDYLLSSIIIIATPLTFVKIILNCKIKKQKLTSVAVFLIALSLNILVYMFTDGIVRSVFGMIICVWVVYEILEISLNKSIFSVILCMILLMIPDFLFLCSCLYVLDLSKEYCYTVLAGSLLSNFIVYGSMIPLTLILRKPLKKLLDISLDYNKKVIIISVLTLISVLVFFFDIIASVRMGTKIILYIIAIITFVGILIFLIIEENKNIKLKVEYEKLLDFMQTYEVELEKERILKHEHKNELIAIKSKIVDNDKQKNIIDYIDSLLGDETKFVQEDYAQFQYLPPNGIKALFYFKLSMAKSKDINTDINIEPSIKESILNDLTTRQFKDLGVLIGVYLDNAIDASELTEEKILGIEMYENEEDVTIIISNSYVGQIDETKVGKTHFSTKGKNRGYGLLLVKQILRTNKKLECEREISPTLYVQTITVKNNENA